MANPNIVSVTSILGNTTFLTPANTTANVLLSNAASSGYHCGGKQRGSGCGYFFSCRLYGVSPCGCVYYRNGQDHGDLPNGKSVHRSH